MCVYTELPHIPSALAYRYTMSKYTLGHAVCKSNWDLTKLSHWGKTTKQQNYGWGQTTTRGSRDGFQSTERKISKEETVLRSCEISPVTKKLLHKNAQHKNSENIFHLQTNLHMGVRILGYEMGQENGFVGGLNPVQMQNWMGISLSRFVLIRF